MIAVIIAIIIAALVYWLLAALGLPFILCLIAALLVLLAAFPLRSRF